MTAVNRRVIDYLKVIRFIDKHPGMYDRYEEEIIRSLAKEGLTDRNLNNDLIREVFDELGMIPDDRNLYVDFMDVLEEVHPDYKDKVIVEIGSGILPRLGERIAEKMSEKTDSGEEHTGRIILFDPLIAKYKDETDRMVIKREKAKKNDRTINWDGVDLLVALKPCKGAEDLINIAAEHKIDFVLGLCEGGPHGDYFDFYESDEEWLDSTMYYAKHKVEDNGMGQLVKRKINKPYYQYPIIYNK